MSEKPKIKVAKGGRAIARMTFLTVEMNLEGRIVDCLGKSLKIEFDPITIPLLKKKVTPPAKWFDLSKKEDFARLTFERAD